MSFLASLPMSLATMGAGAMSMYSTARANKQNMALAQRQMDFQKMMSSTAYQRAMQDMRKAGLNPLLAYSQGGASSPQGASAQMQPELGAGVQSALAVSRARAEVEQIKAQTDLTKAQAQVAQMHAILPSFVNSAFSGDHSGDYKEVEERVSGILQWLHRFLFRGLQVGGKETKW